MYIEKKYKKCLQDSHWIKTGSLQEQSELLFNAIIFLLCKKLNLKFVWNLWFFYFINNYWVICKFQVAYPENKTPFNFGEFNFYSLFIFYDVTMWTNEYFLLHEFSLKHILSKYLGFTVFKYKITIISYIL